MLSKEDVRNYFSRLRDRLTLAEVSGRSKLIFNKVITSEEYLNCDTIFTFINFRTEVETVPIIEKALKDGKKVASPRVKPKTRDMFFIEIKSLEGLVKSNLGILEPVYDENNVVESTEKTLIIVPGLAFDREKYRIGYGGGFYDKYMAKHSFLSKCGVAYDFQRTDKLQVEPFDIPLDKIFFDNDN